MNNHTNKIEISSQNICGAYMVDSKELQLTGNLLIIILSIISVLCCGITLFIFINLKNSSVRRIFIAKSASEIFCCCGAIGLGAIKLHQLTSGGLATSSVVVLFVLFDAGYTASIWLQFQLCVVRFCAVIKSIKLFNFKHIFITISVSLTQTAIFIILSIYVDFYNNNYINISCYQFIKHNKVNDIEDYTNFAIVLISAGIGVGMFLEVKRVQKRIKAVGMEVRVKNLAWFAIRISCLHVMSVVYLASKITVRFTLTEEQQIYYSSYSILLLLFNYPFWMFVNIWQNEAFRKRFFSLIKTKCGLRSMLNVIRPCQNFASKISKTDPNNAIQRQSTSGDQLSTYICEQLEQMSVFGRVRVKTVQNILLKIEQESQQGRLFTVQQEAIREVDTSNCLSADFSLEQLRVDIDLNYKIMLQQLTMTEVMLGHGHFGVVNLAYLKLSGDEQLNVAVKSVTDPKAIRQYISEQDTFFADKKYEMLLLKEMKMMIDVGRHINVLNLLGFLIKEDGRLGAVLEFCEFGNLKDYILSKRNRYNLFGTCNCSTLNEPGKANPTGNTNYYINQQSPSSSGYVTERKRGGDDWISELDLLIFAYQIASGLQYLSSKKVIHGDVALRNMMLTDLCVVKVSDYGLSCQESVSRDDNHYVPFKWMALEALMHQQFSTKSDVWSFGIVLWELFSLGQEPYPGFDQVTNLLPYLIDGCRMDAPKQCPSDVAALMSACWAQNKANRPTFGDCRDNLSTIVQSISIPYWEKSLKLLDQVEAELTSLMPRYLNLQQTYYIKRHQDLSDAVAELRVLNNFIEAD